MNPLKNDIPNDKQKIVGTKPYELNDVGMSDSEVRIYDEYVLKIQPRSHETDNEYAMTKWIGKQIRIPEIFVYSVINDMAYEYSGALKAPVRSDGNHQSGARKSYAA